MRPPQLRIGVHLIRRRILARAARHGGEAAHSSVFRCRGGFEAMSALTRRAATRFEVWDEDEPADAFVARCDVLVGVPDIRLLNARRRSGHRPPYLAMVMGDATRALPWPSTVLRMLQADDTLVCTAAADVDILRTFLRPPTAASLQVAPMPGDLSRFLEGRPLPDVAAALRGVDPGRPVVLSAERLTPEKAVHRIVPFVAHLRDRGHRPVLVVLGARSAAGDYQQGIERQLHEAGLLDDCVWLPFLTPDDLAAVYARARLAVSASTIYDNNFGYVPIESMAAGTPPVVTDWGGYRDSVVDGVTGIHMPTTWHRDGTVDVDWRTAAEAADELLRDAAAYERVRAAGRERVERTFTVEATAHRYGELAAAALARRDPATDSWHVTELGRRAVRAGWTDRMDNIARTARLPRGPRAAAEARAGTAQALEIRHLVYLHYATRVAPDGRCAPGRETVAGSR